MSDRTTTFAELVSEQLIEIGAGRPRTVSMNGHDLPILRVADVLDGSIESSLQARTPRQDVPVKGSKVSRPGDIVLTTKGTVGRVALMPPNGPTFAYSPQLCFFRPAANGPLRSGFLYYWFKSVDFWNQANALKGQTDMADFLSLGDLQRMRIGVPSLDRQDSIVGVLRALDDKIAVNDQISIAADSLRLAILTEMRQRRPADFVAQPLSKVAEFVNGRAFTKNATGNGRMVIRIAEMNSSPGVSTIYNDLEVEDKHLARPGDVLFSWSGTLKVVRWFRPEAIINQHIFKVIPRGRNPHWLAFESVKSLLAYYQAIAADKATTMGHIQRHHLDAEVFVPRPEVLASLDRPAGGLWPRAVAAEQESLTLAALRDNLLPALMSGQLRVKDAEKVVEKTL